MSFTITNQAPITIQITSPTVATLEVYPSVVNELSGTPVYVGDTAGGDLQGTYPNPTVHRIHTHNMQSGLPSNADVWSYNTGTNSWQHRTLAEAGIAGSSHKHTTNDILDIAPDEYTDRYTTLSPFLFFDSNTETYCLSDGASPDSEVDVQIAANGKMKSILINKLGTIPRMLPLSGTYEFNTLTAPSLSTQQLTAQRVYVTPLMPNFTMQCTHFVCSVTTAGVADIKMGIWESDPDTGRPVGAPLYQTNAISTTSTGIKEEANSGGGYITLLKNVQYWIGIMTDSGTQPTVRICNANALIPLYTPANGNGVAACIFYTDTTFSSWRNFTSDPLTTADLSTGNPVPLMGVKLI